MAAEGDARRMDGAAGPHGVSGKSFPTRSMASLAQIIPASAAEKADVLVRIKGLQRSTKRWFDRRVSGRNLGPEQSTLAPSARIGARIRDQSPVGTQIIDGGGNLSPISIAHPSRAGSWNSANRVAARRDLAKGGSRFPPAGCESVSSEESGAIRQMPSRRSSLSSNSLMRRRPR